jgi:hypothetical protein
MTLNTWKWNLVSGYLEMDFAYLQMDSCHVSGYLEMDFGYLQVNVPGDRLGDGLGLSGYLKMKFIPLKDDSQILDTHDGY